MRLIALVLLLGLVACGGDKKAAPPPEKPATGAPVTFVVDKIEPGALHVRVYNFTDKKIAQWGILMRYHDAQGAVLKVKPGTSFEEDHDFWSMTGRSFMAEPKAWSSFVIDHLEIPAGAASAEVLASRVTALGPDGMTFEEEPLWKLDGHGWPDE